MSNPLDGPSTQQGMRMMPGESRTFSYSVDGQPKTITIHRTTRSYAQDLCDAYNANRSRDDVEYVVDGTDQIKLVKPRKLYPLWKPGPGEAEHIHAEVARYIRKGMTQDQFNAMVDSGRWE